MRFKTNFHVPTKDFKEMDYLPLWVTMPDADKLLHIKSIEYKVQIPDFMFDELKDSEPRFKTKYDVNNRNVSGLFSHRDLTRKFKKTQTSINLEVLKDYIYGLTAILYNKYSLETQSKKKKIFIKFNNSNHHGTNGVNNAYRGLIVSQSFSYFTGYEVLVKKSTLTDLTPKVTKQYITQIFYAGEGATMRKRDTGFKEQEELSLDLTALNQSVESFEEEFSIIDWTEEREEFCKKIQDSFINLGEELSMFLNDITEDKFMALMQSNTLKMLTQGKE